MDLSKIKELMQWPTLCFFAGHFGPTEVEIEAGLEGEAALRVEAWVFLLPQ